MEEEVKFTDFIIPICLPSSSQSSYVEGITAGYGRDREDFRIKSTPYHSKLQSISPIDCEKTHDKAPLTVSLENSFCAKSDTNNLCLG